MRKLLALFILVVSICSIGVHATAADISVDPETSFCFSSADFISSDADDGIFLTSIPSRNIATLRYGRRCLQAGDALTVDALNNLTLETACITPQNTNIEYCTVADGKITGVKTLSMSIHPRKNDAPTAKDSSFETYKNIENSGSLDVTDPEGGVMSFELVKAPKRGQVSLHEDGTFTYTPNKNKVGKDQFVYQATDDAGNTSNEATVSINILKPSNKQTYRDMSGDEDQFLAMWLKEEGIYQGATVAGQLCFSPDSAVSRGEFLVMVMRLVDADENLLTTTSGFSDEADTPLWMQPYITTALINGMISGTDTQEGFMFRPTDAMTKAEALVMLQNTLQLPQTTTVFSDNQKPTVPAWAYSAYTAMSSIGMDTELSENDQVLTLREAAQMLYHVDRYIHENDVSNLF